MKLYPALVAVSSGVLMITPVSAFLARLQVRDNFLAQCDLGNFDASFCANVRASLAAQSNLDYALSDNRVLGLTIAALVLAPVVAAIFYVPWKLLTALGNRIGNAKRSRAVGA